MPIEIHPLEILPISLYLILLLYLGLRIRDSKRDEENFILGGRQLTLPAFIATLVTTWYGGILGVGEFSYLYGLSNWLVFGLPYYIFAILFAYVLAPRIRKSNLRSIPDQFFHHYGNPGGYIGTVFTFFMTLPAAYVLMLGLLLQLLTGWSLWLCISLGTLASMIYVLTGGFRAVVRTDKFQFLLMFGGFVMMLAYLIRNFGGMHFLEQNLPHPHLTLHGGNDWQYILVWFFIALWTFIDPGFHQRCYAAHTPGIARRGILFSVLFWAVFDFLTTTTGLYARALLTNINPAQAYPILAHQMLPPLLSGLFLTGLLATIMSTVDSLSLLSAITIGYDFLRRLKSLKERTVDFMQLGLGICGLVSILLAVSIPSVVQIWYVIGTLFIPPMLLPLLACYYPRIRPPRVIIILNLLLSFMIPTLFLCASIQHSTSLLELNYLWGIQPMYPGLGLSLLLFLTGILLNRKSKTD